MLKFLGFFHYFFNGGGKEVGRKRQGGGEEARRRRQGGREEGRTPGKEVFRERAGKGSKAIMQESYILPTFF